MPEFVEIKLTALAEFVQSCVAVSFLKRNAVKAFGEFLARRAYQKTP